MEQLILDIRSKDDARLIKELLKLFKDVEVNSFTPALGQSEMNKRILRGIKDADEGNVKPWKNIKRRLTRKIKSAK